MGRRLMTVLHTACLPIAAVLLAACATSGNTATASARSTALGLSELSTKAGAVEVKARPVVVGPSGAAFEITLDTHSGSLDADLAASSRLEVGGTAWSPGAWKGDPSGGHHRTGTLSFDPGGSPSGNVKLTIGGLAEPVEFTWPYPGR